MSKTNPHQDGANEHGQVRISGKEAVVIIFSDNLSDLFKLDNEVFGLVCELQVKSSGNFVYLLLCLLFQKSLC